MNIKKASFVISNTNYKHCPIEDKAEYAFIGRSNVGKSSLINMLTKTSLAKTSSTPGKTQLINHYLVNNNWFLVDLPGYGYAKTSKKNRNEFSAFSKEYLIKSSQLRCIFVLLDIRIAPQKNDINFMNWLGEQNLPFIRVFSKAEKLNTHKINIAIQEHNNLLLQSWETPPSYILSSSKKKMGRENILNEIEVMNKIGTIDS